jgi:hypothetical protein
MFQSLYDPDAVDLIEKAEAAGCSPILVTFRGFF